jgi:superfamily I DNA/RNA helicase
MIYALAGTGKTTALKLAVPHIPSKSILALAFNKKNAQDLERAFCEPGEDGTAPLAPWVVARSFNALGHRALASATGRRLKLEDKKIAQLTTAHTKKLGGVSDDEWGNLSNLVKRAKMLGLVPAKYPQSRRALLSDDSWGWESAADSINLDLTEALMVSAREILCQAIDLALAGTIDYDDQIYMSVLFSGLYAKFHTVICDEAQDISHLNRLQLMKSCGSRLIIAGDQKQGIYAFRGADSSSMQRIKELRPDWIDLPLTVTWRCPKAVVARQLSHAPQYRAADAAPDGELINLTSEKQWTIARDGFMPDAILCRNNAPLISLAFSLLRKRIAIKVLGRDFGKSLTSIIKKVNGSDSTSIMEFMVAFKVWYEKQCRLAHAADKEEKVDRLTDQFESIMAVAESLDSGARVSELVTSINLLFEQSTGQITLSTGHKAKGLEWHSVLHLDPWRIPSKWARLAASDGDDTPLEQEMNLQYVIETRAKHTLILANLEQFV